MKFYLAWFSFLFASAAGALAQSVSAELVLDEKYYIAGEDVEVKIRVTNFSGRTLKLGSAADWLTFSVDGGSSQVVSQRALVPVTGEFPLDSGNVGIRRFNITPSFDFTKAGHYKVTAAVRIPELNLRIESKAKEFNIVGGTVLWQQDFGVPPDPKAPDADPEIRKYTLLQATKEKDLQLYLRLSDRTGSRPIRVVPIGLLLSFSKPVGQLDKFNNLHVLYQTGAHEMLYTQFTPEGMVLARETHMITDSRPTLSPEKEGRIVVKGGGRRYTSKDIPPRFESASSTETAEEQTEKP